jgi:pimeloyl-ACP methyl ester carboxylesterase
MKSPLPSPSRENAPVLRRAYFDCRFGQLHVHQAIPPGGGFDERTTLLCVPAPLTSAAAFQPLLGPFGRDRSVFAIDAPGAGQSDPAGTDAASALAAAVLDFLQNMRIRRAHVLADGAAAAAVAQVLAGADGRVTRVALCGAGATSFDGRAVSLCVLAPTLSELASDLPAMQAQRTRLREFLDAAAQ